MNKDDVNHLGMGVLIGLLGGNAESVEAFQSAVNKTIKSVTLENESLRFVMDDGTAMALFDDGQSCCESRYMRTDDKLSDFVGAKLLSAQTKEAPSLPNEWGEHEVSFLEVMTDKGPITCSNHNEHNGYYGGFLIRCWKES